MYLQLDTCQRGIGVVQTSPCAGDSLPGEQTFKPFWSGQATRQPVLMNGAAWTNMTAWQNLNRIKKIVILLEAEMALGSWNRISVSGRPGSLKGNCGLSLLLIPEKLKWCPYTSEGLLYSMTACPPTNAFQWNLCNTNWKGNWCWKVPIESPFNHFRNSLRKYSTSWLWFFIP